jgi:uncharacterized membrane protein
MSEPDVTPQARVVLATGYVFTPVVPLVLLANDGGGEPFIRRHARQALYWSPVLLLLVIASVVFQIWLMRQDFLFICLLPAVLIAPFLPGLFWGRKIYLGDDVRLPILTPLAERRS